MAICHVKLLSLLVINIIRSFINILLVSLFASNTGLKNIKNTFIVRFYDILAK